MRLCLKLTWEHISGLALRVLINLLRSITGQYHANALFCKVTSSFWSFFVRFSTFITEEEIWGFGTFSLIKRRIASAEVMKVKEGLLPIRGQKCSIAIFCRNQIEGHSLYNIITPGGLFFSFSFLTALTPFPFLSSFISSFLSSSFSTIHPSSSKLCRMVRAALNDKL